MKFGNKTKGLKTMKTVQIRYDVRVFVYESIRVENQ